MGEIAAKEIVPVDIGKELKQSYLDYARVLLLAGHCLMLEMA